MPFYLLLLILMLPAQAQKTLGRETFQAQVRPVLNGIVNDFYQMITLFQDYPKEIVSVVEKMEKVMEARENLLLACPGTMSHKCQKEIDQLRTLYTDVEGSLLILISRSQPSSSPYLNVLGGQRLLREFLLEVRAINGDLANASFLIRAGINEKRNTLTLVKEIDLSKNYLSLAVVEFIPYTYREDFRQFFFNFVHPIELHIAKNKNFEFLNRNVNSLNFALNLLNMNLTKRNKKTPEGMGPYLNLIHNRWNSLLRYYM